MRFECLSDWLSWQDRLHPTAIDLGLARCARVATRMGLRTPSFPIVSVAGTNGKGSSVLFMESILRAAGYRVGAYLSPHLLRYNERVRVDGEEVSDAELMRAFDAVDRQRLDTSLTYFEFGTLAAMDVFERARPDIVLLEVGLGGRLDAVNLFDAQLCIVTAIGLDHADWLGSERSGIALEKAGIFRRGRHAVCTESQPPQSLIDRARTVGTSLHRLGVDFSVQRRGDSWDWESDARVIAGLPPPGLAGDHQHENAAGAIMALSLLGEGFEIDEESIRTGVAQTRLAGRFQVLSGEPEVIVDVAHNVQAAESLARALRARACAGATHAVVAMFADKDIEGVMAAMSGVVDEWHLAGSSGPRAISAADLLMRVRGPALGQSLATHTDLQSAYEAMRSGLGSGDRGVVFGSFQTAAAVLRLEH